jgi:transposase
MILIESPAPPAAPRNSHLSERYRQLARRRGDKKAILAVAHVILTTSWQLLTTDQLYHDPGPARLRDRDQDQDRARRRAIRQLERLGHKVTLQPRPEAA